MSSEMSQQRLDLRKPEPDDELFASSSPVYVSPSSPVSSPTSPSFFSLDKSRQEREWRKSLAKLEKEIETLQTTLTIKSREVTELRRKLGITRMDELREGVKLSYQSIKESEPVVKTNAALRTVGDFASKKLTDLRNSNTFKSVGEKVGGAYSSVKKKISSARSESVGEELPDQPVSFASVSLEDEDKAFGEKVPL